MRNFCWICNVWSWEFLVGHEIFVMENLFVRHEIFFIIENFH